MQGECGRSIMQMKEGQKPLHEQGDCTGEEILHEQRTAWVKRCMNMEV